MGLLRFAIPAAALAFFGMQSSTAEAAPRVVVHLEAPPIVIAAPAPAAKVWIDGHYEVHRGRTVWVSGHWAARGAPGAVFVPGHWERRGRGKVWVPAHWR
ncbi:MAG: YXWGXW repeat-containing protein [Alphaproteobacteria bacterium]|nr:YXWGXW repeat-containing protein [Alphaproteobacteria bacterium]